MRMVRSLAPVLMRGLCLAGALFSAGAALAQEAGSYRFSPVNQANLQVAASYWNPIIAYVSEKSGVKLSLKLGRTSADTTAYVLAQEVEFVFTNHLFSPEREKLGWKVFGRRLTPALHSQIVVPADSPSRTWPSWKTRTWPSRPRGLHCLQGELRPAAEPQDQCAQRLRRQYGRSLRPALQR